MAKRFFIYATCLLLTLIIISGCVVSPPVNVALKQISTDSAKISWGNRTIVQGYTIERKDADGEYLQIATVPFKLGMEKAYTDSGLDIGIAYTYRIRAYFKDSLSEYSDEAQIILSENPLNEGFIIDHNCRSLSVIPAEWIAKAKSDLHIAYQHTSPGSQITTGMTGLAAWKGSKYAYNSGGTSSALDFKDRDLELYAYSSGTVRAGDLGNPDWYENTRNYLRAKPAINVIMWSWCGQVSYASEADINTYLSKMNQLELEFPNVRFIYMTGHLDGTGLNGTLHKRNEQIRAYCRTNNKKLYDFADIETYGPDGSYYGNKFATDGCNYDYNNSGATSQSGDPALPAQGDRNWAIDWQNSHTLGVDWFNCESAHSQPLNANLKAYAAWWMFARIAGWEG